MELPYTPAGEHRRPKQRVPLQDTTPNALNYSSPYSHLQSRSSLNNSPNYVKQRDSKPAHQQYGYMQDRENRRSSQGPPAEQVYDHTPERGDRRSAPGQYSAAAAYISSPEPSSRFTSPDHVANPDCVQFSPRDAAGASQVPGAVTQRRSRKKKQVGPWLLGEKLGQGTSGKVRLATNMETGMKAAIKIVPKDTSGARMQRNDQQNTRQVHGALPARLEKEVVIMKLINHPNVLSLIDVWENSHELYLVLEYVNGGELFEYIQTRGRLPEDEAIIYFRQILSALDFCQKIGICHRDLKPENILLDGHGNVKVADFGLAALQPKGRLLDTSCGSPHYAAPEVIAGGKYDGRKADVWSCGVILYTLLAGSLPFDHDDVLIVHQKVRAGVFRMPDVSAEAQNLVWHMLIVDSRKRITLDEIWSHPLIMKYAPKDSKGFDLDRGPTALDAKDVGRPVNSAREIDREVIKNLMSVLPGMRSRDIVKRVLSNEPNKEKLIYSLLMRHRLEHLENYPGSTPEENAEAVAQSLESSCRTSVRRQPAAITSRQSSQQAHSRRISAGSINHHTGHADESRTSAEFQSDPAAYQLSPESVRVLQRGSDRSSIGPAEPYRQEQSYRQEQRPERTIRVASRASLASSIHRPQRRVGSSRHYGSRSSLASYRSNSPSTNRITARVSSSNRRRVSFNHTAYGARTPLKEELPPNSGNGRKDNDRIEEPLNAGVTVPDEEKEGSPVVPVNRPYAGPTPRARRSRMATTNNRSTVIIDGRTIEGTGYAESPIFHRHKESLSHNADFQERKRQVSKELEDACNDAFYSRSSSIQTKFSPLPNSDTPPRRKSGMAAVSPNITIIQSSPPGNQPTLSRAGQTERSLRQSGGKDRVLFDVPEGSVRNSHLYEKSPLDLLEARSQRNSVLPEDKMDLDSPSPILRSLPALHRPISQYSTVEVDDLVEQAEYGIDAGFKFQDKGVASAPQPKSAHDNEIADNHASIFAKYMRKEAPSQRISLDMHRKSPRIHASCEADGVRSYTASDRAEASDTAPTKCNPPKQKVEYGLFPRTSNAADEMTRPVISINGLPQPQASELTAAQGVTARAEPKMKKKRSLFEILTCKKLSLEPHDKTKKGPDAAGGAKVDRKSSAMVHGGHNEGLSGKETVGRFTLNRWASRDMQKEVGEKRLSMPRPENPVALSLGSDDDEYNEDTSDDEALWGVRDEFKRVQSQRNWVLRFLNIKPASQIVCFSIPGLIIRKEIMKLWKEWRKYGLIIVQDDRTGLVMRARVGQSNYLNMKEVSFVAEIRLFSGSRKKGTGVARFTQEKGAASSFNRVVDEMVSAFNEKNILVQDNKKITRMARVFL